MTAPEFKARRSLIAATGSALLLGACGFHLRGVRDLPFATVFINASPYAEMTAQIRRAIDAQSTTRVTDEIKEAEAVIDITENRVEKVILSLNSAGRVREYQLRQRFGFKVRTVKGEEIAPVSTIEVRRDLTSNDVEVLAKQEEEQLLYAEMQGDVVQQLLRRLQAIKKKPA
ncbi:LPS assembly lipoprotein LptE [Methyloversatilis sp. XJ19-49]|uniref:LPS-assembly lipoprotein LptE n=1 Tax=Methyloversatilis sp. XJ19-49 TaxID=2963429 RepID=UPI00211BE867|nr:LPS assembly lipoprotein LptE [Methyloversatilis sp. XJ19-49]